MAFEEGVDNRTVDVSVLGGKNEHGKEGRGGKDTPKGRKAYKCRKGELFERHQKLNKVENQ